MKEPPPTGVCFRFVQLALFACLVFAESANQPLVLHSRPDLRAPRLNVSLHEQAARPGHIFISPYFYGARDFDAGPYIFENSGGLIWSGVDSCVGAGVGDIRGLHVCLYQNVDHLCFWKGRQREMHGRGVGMIMNQHYEVIETVVGADSNSIDFHEFHLISGGSAIVTTYRPRFLNSTWILDSAIQEINVRDNSILFEWWAADHVDMSESRVPRGSYPKVGDGLHSRTAWDFFHINSAEKTIMGDYVISARHTDCVYKISRRDGSILWRLGGDLSSFTFENLTFRRQHDARVQVETREYTIISLFDNHNDEITLGGAPSQGIVIKIDHLARTAFKTLELNEASLQGLVSPNMGGMKALAGGGFFVNWAHHSAMVEFDSNGTSVWYAQLSRESLNYRAYKGHWVGLPTYPPALWTYAHSSDSAIHFHVSWNGATEVRLWKFYASETENGPFHAVGSATRRQFETTFTLNAFFPWTMVEALGASGSLGNSTPVKTTIVDNYGNRIEEIKPPHPSIAIAPLPSFPLMCRYFEHIMAILGTGFCVVACMKRRFLHYGSWRKVVSKFSGLR